MRSERSGICVSSTRLIKEWGNDWDGTRSLRREDIYRNKIQQINNLRVLIHGEEIPQYGCQSVVGILHPTRAELP
jgi:hypothetical protein